VGPRYYVSRYYYYTKSKTENKTFYRNKTEKEETTRNPGYVSVTL